MSLLDLKPRKSSFKGIFNGCKLRLWMRPFTLRDQAWLQERFGANEFLQKALIENDINTISEMLWHQLTAKSKKEVLGLPARFADENGNEIELKSHEFFLGVLDEKSLPAALEAFAMTRNVNAAKVRKALVQDQKKKMKRTGL